MSANKKSNKKNRRNNYKIEALEPRLMMDATIASWENEASSFSVLPTTNVINWLNETFQNVSKVDSSTGSKSSLQVKEVLESEIDVADYGDIKEEIKTQFKDAVDDFREEKVSEYKAAHSGVSDKEAENAVAGQLFKASDIVAKMSRFKVNDWSISFKADGSNPDVIIFTVSKNGTRTIKDDLDAFVARDSNINVNLECQTKDNVVYSAKFDIFFDINNKTGQYHNGYEEGWELTPDEMREVINTNPNVQLFTDYYGKLYPGLINTVQNAKTGVKTQ